jgi:acyl-CoA thioester hydrolase
MKHPELDGFPVIVRLPIQWGDMDAYGHVNNTVYFRFFETARIEYLIRCGFVESHARDKIGAILHSTSCRFRRPLTHPDDVMVGGRAPDVGDDRFTMEYRIVSLGQNAIAAEGTGVIVSFDYAGGKKVPLPSGVRGAIGGLEREA